MLLPLDFECSVVCCVTMILICTHSQSLTRVCCRRVHQYVNRIEDVEFFKADAALTQCNGKAPGVSGFQVATGFYSVYQSLQGQLSSAITQLRLGPAAGYNVVITGHSLGAALATLAAVDMTCGTGVNSKPITVYNYGSPRIGNDDFYELVESLDMRVLRHTHYKGSHLATHMDICVPRTKYFRMYVFELYQ